MDRLKMYFLLKMGIFHCYVSLPKGSLWGCFPYWEKMPSKGKQKSSWTRAPSISWYLLDSLGILGDNLPINTHYIGISHSGSAGVVLVFLFVPLLFGESELVGDWSSWWWWSWWSWWWWWWYGWWWMMEDDGGWWRMMEDDDDDDDDGGWLSIHYTFL